MKQKNTIKGKNHEEYISYFAMMLIIGLAACDGISTTKRRETDSDESGCFMNEQADEAQDLSGTDSKTAEQKLTLANARSIATAIRRSTAGRRNAREGIKHVKRNQLMAG